MAPERDLSDFYGGDCHRSASPKKYCGSRRTLTVASVEQRVIDIVAEQLGVSKDQITRETSFVNDLAPILWIRSSW